MQHFSKTHKIDWSNEPQCTGPQAFINVSIFLCFTQHCWGQHHSHSHVTSLLSFLLIARKLRLLILPVAIGFKQLTIPSGILPPSSFSLMLPLFRPQASPFLLYNMDSTSTTLGAFVPSDCHSRPGMRPAKVPGGERVPGSDRGSFLFPAAGHSHSL